MAAATERRVLALTTDDGIIDAILFVPAGHAPVPAVVLLTDIRGSRPVYETLAGILAAKGYAVLLPNLYYRSQPAPVVEEGAPFDDLARTRLQGFRARLTVEALTRDFATFVAALDDALEVDAERIGVVGYCMSGAIALRFAAAFPERVRAAASFHGGTLAVEGHPESPHLLAPVIAARIHVGHADADASAPPDQIARLDQALATAGRDFTTEFYAGAHHGFAIADSAAYNASASARHLRALANLFEDTLS